MLQLAFLVESAFTYVDCGARVATSSPLLDAFADARYAGFEPDPADCDRLTQSEESNHLFFPGAVGRQSEARTLYVTHNLYCSVLVPNQTFLGKSTECETFFTILEVHPTPVMALDSYLPRQGVGKIGYLELDTQGADLEILKGAQTFLSASVLGARIEVEFAAMYQGQPLFWEVDAYLQRFGFIPFGLEPYYLRRKAFPPHLPIREQLVWGQAHYLKNHCDLPIQDREQKNHKIVIQALECSRKKPPVVAIVCTGSTSDYRDPLDFTRLLESVSASGIRNDLILLGFVPHRHVFALMRQSLAVLQSYLVEGRGTMVEESKSLGKRVRLSDIAVH